MVGMGRFIGKEERCSKGWHREKANDKGDICRQERG